MSWVKKRLIIDNNVPIDWSNGRAIVPIPELFDQNKLRIYFSTLDELGRSQPVFIETNASEPELISKINNVPILELGQLGTFDDSGITVSCIVPFENKRFLYYIGWNQQKNVSYKLAIGLAISVDGGPFRKFSSGPILDRDINEPYFNTAPYVLIVGEVWHMWYVSCYEWKIVNDWPEPLYNIKHATSVDGIHWSRSNKTCIFQDDFAEAIGKPTVYIENGKFHMIYSYRNSVNYRVDRNKSYRLGCAESKDGLHWIRKDSEIGIELSDIGWDSMMMEYASTYVINNNRYMLYNGNGFGESGFGYAIKEYL